MLTPLSNPPLVLVIEDERAIVAVLVETLAEEGYEVLWAPSADAALTALETVAPALITLDLRLPGISGRTLLRLLRALPATQTIPIIIISAEIIIEPQLRAACQAVIAKPFALHTLTTTVQSVLASNSASTTAAAHSGGQTRSVGESTTTRSAAQVD